MTAPPDSCRRLLDAEGIRQVLARMAGDLLAKPYADQPIAVVGIQRRGVPLGRRLRDLLMEKLGRPVEFGLLDITLYRDDLSGMANNPVVNRTIVPFDVTGMVVVLVDDVLYTGRTIRAALDVLADLGRPARVVLAPLIDRGLREYPIQPDVTGLHVETRADQQIQVHVTEIDGDESVHLLERPTAQKS